MRAIQPLQRLIESLLRDNRSFSSSSLVLDKILSRDIDAEDEQIRRHYEYIAQVKKPLQCQDTRHIGTDAVPAFGFELEIRPSHGLGLFVKAGTIPAFTACAIYPGIVFSPTDPKLWWGFFNEYMIRRDDGWVVDGKPYGLSGWTYKSLHARNSDRVIGEQSCDMTWLQAERYRKQADWQSGDNHGNDLIWFHCGHYINHSAKNNVEYVQKNFNVERFTTTNENDGRICWLPNVEYSSSGRQSMILPGIILVANRDVHQGEELTANYENIVSETSREE